MFHDSQVSVGSSYAETRAGMDAIACARARAARTSGLRANVSATTSARRSVRGLSPWAARTAPIPTPIVRPTAMIIRRDGIQSSPFALRTMGAAPSGAGPFTSIRCMRAREHHPGLRATGATSALVGCYPLGCPGCFGVPRVARVCAPVSDAKESAKESDVLDEKRLPGRGATFDGRGYADAGDR